MPAPDQRKKSAYLKSREAETAAIADLKEAQNHQAKYGRAKALVGHAKGTWIGGAEKQIAQAKEKLKNAGNDAQRDAAKEELAKAPTEESTEAVAEDRGMSPSYRRLLSLSLLRGLVDIDTDGTLKPLPMDLSVTRLKVNLVEAKGSGILVFRAIRGGKLVPIALEDLALKDQALLARFVARLRPDDPTASARAGVYMEFLGNEPVALGYKRKAGRETVEQFEAMLGNSAK